MSSNQPQTNQFKDQLKEAKERFKNSPQTKHIYEAWITFWSQYGYPIKLTTVILVILFVIVTAINFGLNVSRRNQPKTILPEDLPGVSPTKTITRDSELNNLRQTVKDFSVILPDPGAPPVDPEIYIGTPPKN